MEKYKYRAMNEAGRPVRGVLSAANENDLFSQLQSAGLELVSCSPVSKKGGLLSAVGVGKSVKIRELIQFFLHLRQMQGAGIPLLDSLADIRDTADNDYFRDILSEMYRDVSEGSSFSEALANHPKIFTNLYVSLISSGEESGDIATSCDQLIVYLKWVDSMQVRVRKATRYPTILLIAVVLTVVVMMAFVVPQIVDFIKELDQELPFITTSLMATSDFFVANWMYIFGFLIFSVIGVVVMSRTSDSFAYRRDAVFLKLPIMGDLIRKINIARFAQTFGSLFMGGIDTLKALDAATQTVNNRVLNEALDNVQRFVREGAPMSEAMNRCGEFPSMVIRMVRVGEESGNLTDVLNQVAEFYTNDVDEEVEKVIAMIEPALTLILGVMILWIAAGVFGPIYNSFSEMDF